MAQSCSDSTEESESDSSKGETIYDTIRAHGPEAEAAPGRRARPYGLVLRIVIEDLQQAGELPPARRPPSGP